MPCGYDCGRGYRPEQLTRWLDVISRAIGDTAIATILDLGCGTGRYSGALAARFGAWVIGVEPSQKMLAEAIRKTAVGVSLIRGNAESLPLADESVDLVFISMVFHHFKDRAAAAQECRRVLRPGGRLCLRAGTLEQIENYAYVPFFPESRSLLEQHLVSRATIEETFAAAGLRLDRHGLVPSEAGANWSDYAERLAHRADSILIRLQDSDFARGLEAVRKRAEKAPFGAVVEPVDFFVFRAV